MKDVRRDGEHVKRGLKQSVTRRKPHQSKQHVARGRGLLSAQASHQRRWAAPGAELLDHHILTCARDDLRRVSILRLVRAFAFPLLRASPML